MTFLSILIGNKGSNIENTHILSASYNLREFYMFQKNGVKELCNFIARNGFYRNEVSKYTHITHKGFYVSYYSNTSGLCICAVFNDNNYPSQVIKRVLKLTLDEYISEYDDTWKNCDKDFSLPMKNLDNKLIKYNNPENADTLYKINADLQATKTIMHENINKILERGEKIDELVEKSRDLSKSSKKFYKTTRKMNSCCNIS
jgi:synaptobrevin homolog YKT6